MPGQLVYALFQQNWDNDVVIGHLAGWQSVGEARERRQRGRGGGVFGKETKKKKSISRRK